MRSNRKQAGSASGSNSDNGSRVVSLPHRSNTKGSSDQTNRAGTTSRLIRRINLDLPEKPASHLDWLQEETGAVSTAEVIRTALKLYYGLACEVKAGGSILLRAEDGTEKEIKVFL